MRFYSICIATLISGCGTTAGLIGKLPEIQDKNRASTVIVYRINNAANVFNATYNNFTIAIDGSDIYGIESGSNVKFMVDPGQHVISVKCFGGLTPTTKEDALAFTAEPRSTQYFEATPANSLTRCARISQVEDTAGAKGVKATIDLVK